MQLLSVLLTNDDSDSARELLKQELSNPIYKEQISIYEWILQKINRFLSSIIGFSTDMNKGISEFIVIVILLLVATSIVVYAVYKRKQSSKAERIASSPIFTDNRSYKQLIISAVGAVNARKDYTTGMLESYRAIVKYLQETSIITVTKGMTCTEAAVVVGVALPEFKDRFDTATNYFNRVMYGDRTATETEYLFTQAILEDILAQFATSHSASYEGFGYGGIH